MAQPITGRISSSAFAVLFWRAPSSTRRSGATRWLRSSTIKSLSSSTAAAATTTTQNTASRYSPAAAPNTQQQQRQQSTCFFPQSLTLTWRRFVTSGNIGNNSGKPKEQNEDNSTWLGTIKAKVQKTVGKSGAKGDGIISLKKWHFGSARKRDAMKMTLLIQWRGWSNVL